MKRFTWGHGLALVLAAFAGLLVLLTREALSTDYHLVREDYYAAELRHSDRMEEEARGTGRPLPALASTEAGLQLSYPADAGLEAIDGELHIYSPARPQDDQTVALCIGRDGRAEVPLVPTPQGRAYVEVRWQTPEGWAVQKVAYDFPVPAGGGR